MHPRDDTIRAVIMESWHRNILATHRRTRRVVEEDEMPSSSPGETTTSRVIWFEAPAPAVGDRDGSGDDGRKPTPRGRSP